MQWVQDDIGNRSPKPISMVSRFSQEKKKACLQFFIHIIFIILIFSHFSRVKKKVNRESLYPVFHRLTLLSRVSIQICSTARPASNF
jgi:3-phosphoglycerate kinase